ncbi:type II secretion system minor pseudopilin GspH [Colwellia sp. 20A7]|uniref:type II secretion system minor pseudopilin GspH n=1 Tax=Colwellia sp. 20A7 TaxID=2689569 RepID=UPI001F35D819|nr:type II secretion system minor pseudopilin GspH [Colwellia sp. 20A7]
MKRTFTTKNKGFTLLEVLVVIALIGLIISAVQFNFSTKRPEDTLKKVSYEFSTLFESAANYGLLNNIELGLYIDKSSYQFLGYDGLKWSEIPEQDWLAAQELPEGVTFTLELDDLPIEEPLLFDSSAFGTEEESYLSFDDIEKTKKSDDEKGLTPQVYILSGGDITPFSLTFYFTDEASLNEDLSDLAYRVSGLYSTPLKVEGPVLDD